MDTPNNLSAWLETEDGKVLPVVGSCSIGRSRSNQVVLSDGRVSRRHTLVHAQGRNEFWVVDFGSINGTRVNSRRLAQPTALRNGDVIEVADARFRFRQQPLSEAAEERPEATAVTAREIKNVPAWLLVADIVGSTQLTHSLPPDELPVLLGQWFSLCHEVLETQHGTVNKYLGDGLFALWLEPPDAASQVAAALRSLGEAQARPVPEFRLVLHHGNVASAGTQKTGEESILGNQVHFVFRMEKLAGALGARVLLSEPAARKLEPFLATTPVGRYPLSGFEDTYLFFSPST